MLPVSLASLKAFLTAVFVPTVSLTQTFSDRGLDLDPNML